MLRVVRNIALLVAISCAALGASQAADPQVAPDAAGARRAQAAAGEAPQATPAGTENSTQRDQAAAGRAQPPGAGNRQIAPGTPQANARIARSVVGTRRLAARSASAERMPIPRTLEPPQPTQAARAGYSVAPPAAGQARARQPQASSSRSLTTSDATGRVQP